MVPEIADKEGTIVITLPRRFDTDSAPVVDRGVQPVLEQRPKRLLFDFSKTDYVSSAGMRILVKTAHAAAAWNGTIAFSSLNRQVEYIFEIAGFHKIFTIYTSQDKALKHMNRKE